MRRGFACHGVMMMMVMMMVLMMMPVPRYFARHAEKRAAVMSLETR